MPRAALVTENTTVRLALSVLTEAGIKQAAPRDKTWKLFDSGSLYLLVKPNGAKWWRWDYRLGGRRKTLSFGVYGDVSLAEARQKRDTARKLLEAGTDPSVARQRDKRAAFGATLQDVWTEWAATRVNDADATKKKRKWIVEQILLPALGRYRVADIEPMDVVHALRPLDRRGVAETTHRAKQVMGQLLTYAVATGRAKRNFIPDLKSAFRPVKVRNHPSVKEPHEVGALLRAIDGSDHAFAPTLFALRMAPYVFVRPSELRRAEWTEFDFNNAIWRIPAAKMKARRLHLVPLSRQVLELLEKVRPFSGSGRYVFPAVRTGTRPMSNGTLGAALRRLGYTSDQMVPHGFRSIASTRMNEMGWDAELIELQLAHIDLDSVRAAYNKSIRIDERRELMQNWADYLDKLKESR